MGIMKYALVMGLMLQGSLSFAGAEAAAGPAFKSIKPFTGPYQSSKANAQAAQIEALQKNCSSAGETAHNFCLAELNPKMQTALAGIGLLLSGVQMLKSSSEACQKYGQAMKMAEVAITAYNTMCTTAQMNCESACGEAQSGLQKIIADVRIPSTPAESAGANSDATTIDGWAMGPVGTQLGICRGYKLNLAAAGVGLMNVLKQSGASSSCQNATTDVNCAANPTDPTCVAKTDCTRPENANITTCICQKTPNATGCPGATPVQALTPPNPRGPNNTSDSNDKTNTSITGLDNGNFGGVPGSSGGGSSGSGSPGGSGGGGGLGSGGTGAKSAGADGKKVDNKFNTNILSGYDGGGGGGGSHGGGSGSSDSAYKAYLPGGAKDPTRGLASQTFGNGQVTGAGSKSNWEKVSDRYLDNKPTLMGP